MKGDVFSVSHLLRDSPYVMTIVILQPNCVEIGLCPTQNFKRKINSIPNTKNICQKFHIKYIRYKLKIYSIHSKLFSLYKPV
jgi:hypothetical protein